ncbi:MAG: hypothetical protein JZU63_05535, partial [Rhodoferax sp.]|nr:hypothetical protein [Rhodoferax sp.]
SHAPTSGEDYTTKGQGSSQDKGEAVKKAMKEAVNQLLDGDSSAIDSFLGEGGHKAGCTCGFCKNKGKFGKKKSEDDGESDCDKADKPMDENLTLHPDTQPPRPGGDRIGFRKPLSRPDRLKGERGLEGWRRGPKQNPSLSRHYAGGKPGTPSMECLNTNHTIQSIADRFLDYPA